MQDFTLGGVVIGSSEYSYTGAQWNRFNDWSQLGTLPQGEWNALPTGERHTIITRLRWLTQNNEYCKALVSTFVTHLGNSTLRSKARDNPAANDERERFWLDYSASCEVSGLSLSEVEEIIFFELLCAGEIFIQKLKNGQFQLIPSEFVLSKSDAPDNEIQGISYSDTGVPIGYRIGHRDHHGQIIPGETLVPAALVMHVFRRERVEMLRGVPWLAAALKPLKDIEEITNAKVQSVKNQSFLTYAVTRDGGAGQFPNLADTGNTKGDTKATGRPNKYITLQTGTIIWLDKGEKVEALSTQFQSQDFSDFLLSRLRAVGATIGLPLELFLEGYKDSNYSSSRATNLAWNKKVKKIRSLIENRFLQPLHLWASERGRATGRFMGNRALDREIHWGWPAVPSIDESKEVDANVKKLGAGLTSYTDVYAEQNKFFDDEVKVRARDMRLIQEAAEAEGIDPQLLAPDLDFSGGGETKDPSTDDDTDPPPSLPPPESNKS
jgi:lambda family phage portal protein